MIIDYPWYYVILCLLVGATYATVLYFTGHRRFGKGTNLLLAGLRFLAVSAIALLLLAPVARQKVEERQKPLVVIAQDVSQSVLMSADSAIDASSINGNGRYDIIHETFGGSTTDIASALSDIATRYQGRNLGAVVLASDGIYNRGSNPVTVAEQLPFPVYTIALGDTTPQRDATVGNLRCNRIAMMGNSFPVEVTIGATLLNGQSSRLTVHDARGHQQHTQPIHYQGNDYSTTVTINLTAQEPGLQRYTLRLAAVEGETLLENNVLTFYVDVIDTRQRIAIIANAPHPDIAALRQAIESNPHYEVQVVMASDAESGKWKADKDVSLAILHNLPSKQHTSVAYADALPKLYIIGLQTDLSRFNALHTGLEIVAKANGINEVTALYQPAFTLFSLDADDAAAIENLPPLTAPFGEARTTAGLQSLFTARLGHIDTRQPLVAATAQGEQRCAFIWGEGLWRWRLADYQGHQSHRHIDRFISQLTTFTALQTQRQRLQVRAERTYATGDPVTLGAELYNESYQLTNTSEVSLHLEGDSLRADYSFHRAGQGYSLTLPYLKEGLYRYRATTTDGLSTEGSFAVEAISLEQQRLVADHSLLASIAALTGGEMVTPQELSSLNSQLSTLKPTLYTHTRYAEVLKMPLVLALIVLLLAAEWVLRKYHGEI